MSNDIFQKFTPNLKQALVDAEKIATERKSSQDTEHQLLAVLQNKDTLASEILIGFGITLDRIELVFSLISHSDQKIGMTEDAKKSIQLAVQAASKYKHNSIGSEHLLIALISDKSFHSYLIIERLGIDPQKIKNQVESIFSGISKSFSQKPAQDNPEMIQPEDILSGDDNVEEIFFGGMPPFANQAANQSRKKDSILDQYSKNLTKSAKDRKIDTIVGRDKEMARIIQTLSRRTKNNPILVGEPGVGKTAIVEGLARKIVNNNVPPKLIGTEILSLDLGSILAGTMYRGQFESRIKKILAEIEKRGNIILFIDEIHTMIGAGSTEGSIDAANLLKPMLAKGQLRLIGSTTFDEYKKHIEKDAAFERRFQPVYILEPTFEEAAKILKGIKGHYENFHHVRYTPESITAAIALSKRYIHDRFLPDKAIDLIDEAGASKNSHVIADPLLPVKNELAKVLKEKENLILAEKYEQATMLREKEIKLQNEIEKIQAKKAKINPNLVTDEDIAALVSEWTGVPVSALNLKERKKYSLLEQKLKKNIIGQNEAIDELAKAIKRSRTGISHPDRPIGSFIFLGPTGVGKTELTKVLAQEIFGSEKSLIKIDMSEFGEKHNVARLIGAPAGYVGYEEGGKLTEQVRKNPYSVILFDEIEKAHPEVFNILLQIMDDGTLTDAKGRKVDFKNAIIIMTSNLGTDILRRQAAIGFENVKSDHNRYEKMKENVIETIEKTFRPEFINRLDKIIVFYPLDQKSIRKIVDLQIEELSKRLQKQNIKIFINTKVRDFIAKNSYTEEYGARPIRKFIADNIENLISDKILEQEKIEKLEIKIELEKDRIILK